jgi:hypothetical protein
MATGRQLCRYTNYIIHFKATKRGERGCGSSAPESYLGNRYPKMLCPILLTLIRCICGVGQTTYTDGKIVTSGVTNSTCSGLSPVTATFLPGEQITSISGTAGWGFDSIIYKTSQGRVLGPYGFDHAARWSFTGPIYGFYGTTFPMSGCPWRGAEGAINGLGVYTAASSSLLPSLPLPSPHLPIFLPALVRNHTLKTSYLTVKASWDYGSHASAFD